MKAKVIVFKTEVRRFAIQNSDKAKAQISSTLSEKPANNVPLTSDVLG